MKRQSVHLHPVTRMERRRSTQILILPSRPERPATVIITMNSPTNNSANRASSISRTSSRNVDERVSLKWENLTYETTVKDTDKSTLLGPVVYKNKKILKGLSGSAESGQLLAILGPTGCGKTSLLNVLAARVPSGGQKFNKLTGDIYMNGKKRDEEKFRNVSAYVMQDDNMYPHLTVFESLMLAGHFFLPASLTDEKKREIVDATIAELGLVKARDTCIGDDDVRGVSGGERKRASIATQLLTDPAVLFLDEPTSGLDAFQSQAVMECLSSLASDGGRLVITVIHQPRSSIYEMFDKLLVLSEGRTIFYGDARDAVAHFAAAGHVCPDVFNPSDYFLDLLSPDNRTPETEQATRNRIQYLGDRWLETQASQLQARADKSAKDGPQHSEAHEFRSVQIIGSGANDFASVRRNFLILCWRAWTEQSRNQGAIIAKILFNCFFGLIIGGIYSDIGYAQESIQNRKGCLFFLMINQNFGSVTGVLNSFPKEKAIVNRERSGRAYNTLSYFCAKFLVEMPINLAPIVIYNCIAYPIIGFQKERFGYFILISMLCNCASITLGLAVSAVSADVDHASAVGIPVLILSILFGGFYISIDSLPIVANWVPYITIFRWAYQAMCINEFRGLEFTCDSANTAQCISTGDQVLQTLDFAGHTTAYPCFGLGMVLLGLLAIAFSLLAFSTITYTPLGYVGKAYLKTTDGAGKYEDTADCKAAEDKNQQGYEMVPTSSGDREGHVGI